MESPGLSFLTSEGPSYLLFSLLLLPRKKDAWLAAAISAVPDSRIKESERSNWVLCQGDLLEPKPNLFTV